MLMPGKIARPVLFEIPGFPRVRHGPTWLLDVIPAAHAIAQLGSGDRPAGIANLVGAGGVGATRPFELTATTDCADGLDPTLVEPQPNQSPDRYLIPDDRDFFAVYSKVPGPVVVPFK